jgi:DNA modification methylase
MTTPYYRDDLVTLHHGDSLEVSRVLPSESVDCIVTSPPYYGLRDYGSEGQYGLEATPAEYVETMRALFSELRRVLADDGTLWLNLGDSYGKRKQLTGIPWRVAFALQDDGWTLRNSIIWAKTNGMPTSVADRLSSRHENIFLFSKSPSYWFDLDPIRQPHAEASIKRYAAGLNKQSHPSAVRLSSNANEIPAGHTPAHGVNPGDVWTINTDPFPGAHFAVSPREIPRRAILAGCKPGGTVLDPFSGSGTTGEVALSNGRKYVGIDISAEYLDLSLKERFAQPPLNFGAVA